MIFKQAAHLAWRAIDGETVIIDIRGKRVLWLNPTASRLWQALENEGSAADLASRLGTGVPVEDAAGHLRILDELCNAGVLTCDPKPDQSAEQLPDQRVVPFPSQATGVDSEQSAILWIEPLERFAGLCGKTPTDIGIPDCMASPNLS